MIERKEYMDRLIGYRDKQVIKIITAIFFIKPNDTISKESSI